MRDYTLPTIHPRIAFASTAFNGSSTSLRELYMQVSAEIRWFFKTYPASLHDWFCRVGYNELLSKEEKRTDRYLVEGVCNEIGIKKRGNNDGVEIKGLVSRSPRTTPNNRFPFDIEIWIKWPVKALCFDVSKELAVNKVRRLRKYDTNGSTTVPVPALTDIKGQGCNVEWTAITMEAGETWWTLGFESFGTLLTVGPDVEKTMDAMFQDFKDDAVFQQAQVLSYPAWLATKPFVGK